MIKIITSRIGAELFKDAMKPLLLKDLKSYKRPKLDKEEITAWWDDPNNETNKLWHKVRKMKYKNKQKKNKQ